MNAPFGWRVDDYGRVVPDPNERVVVTNAVYYRRRGHSLRGVVRRLAAQGFTNRRGRPLTLTAVARVLARAEGEGLPPLV